MVLLQSWTQETVSTSELPSFPSFNNCFLWHICCFDHFCYFFFLIGVTDQVEMEGMLKYLFWSRNVGEKEGKNNVKQKAEQHERCVRQQTHEKSMEWVWAGIGKGSAAYQCIPAEAHGSYRGKLLFQESKSGDCSNVYCIGREGRRQSVCEENAHALILDENKTLPI